MEIKIETSEYNSKRFGNPWIARVEFIENKMKLYFGTWIGNIGESGILLLNAEPGDIVTYGQKDLRKVEYSKRAYLVVNNDGSLSRLSGPVAAYELWESKRKVSREDLILEKHILLDRLEEIEHILTTLEK